MNQRISIDGETFLGDIGIQPELLSFQGNLATKQLIETLQQYPIFKLKSTNADGSYNTYLSVANMKKVTEAINPTLLPLIVQLSDSYADTFDNIILKPSEKSLKIILESSDYGEKREILLSEGKIFASYTDPFYEGDNDFYFVYVKGEKGIKF
ncbi:MAG: hypothetical protein LBI53_03480 [Candidatus Peribacteria bacterium]|jgi:hypothetical protein|nr:hypothetical protein [Candidatus Peribacteria bacterium]